VKASGVDIVVALDLSGSMISEDFVVRGERVNRFNMARSVLKRFIDKRPNDRIGLVVFAAQAFIATPLTLDHDYLQENLDRLEIGTINRCDGHRRRVDTAVNRLRDLKAKSKIIILMTDGQNNSGKLEPLTGGGSGGGAGRENLHGRHRRARAGADAGVHGRAKSRLSKRAGGRGRGHAAKNRGQDRRKILSRGQRGKFRQIYAEIDKLEKTEASHQ
jgi:Ca-activated chloride channel family protein